MFYGLNKPDLVPLRVFGLKRSHNESACGTFQGNESETSESSNMLFQIQHLNQGRKKIQATPTKHDLGTPQGFFSKFPTRTPVLLISPPRKQFLQEEGSSHLSGECDATKTPLHFFSHKNIAFRPRFNIRNFCQFQAENILVNRLDKRLESRLCRQNVR